MQEQFKHPILDTSRLYFTGNFEQQVDQLLNIIRLTKEEVENMDHLLRDLSANFHRIWPGCRIEPFGSIITGLGIKTSDIDCFVNIPRWVKKSPKKLVFQAFHSLSWQPDLFAEIQPIARAKVPIIKFVHIPTGWPCDASFKNPHGIRNSSLLGYLLHLDARALPVAIIIKYWAKVHKLTGTNFMPNYALILLVVFYLQQVNVLPTVYELQANLDPHQQCFIDHWETGFVKIPEYTLKNRTNGLNMYELLGGFFEFYSSYDFARNIVSIFIGSSIKRELFKNLNTVPTVFRLYDTNLSNGLVQPLKIDDSMCIQDPFDHSRNCAVAVKKNIFTNIVDCIKHAAKCYREKRSSDFLKAILTVIQQPPFQHVMRKPPNKVSSKPATVPPKPITVPTKPAPIPVVINSKMAGFQFIKKFNQLHHQYKQRSGKRKGHREIKH